MYYSIKNHCSLVTVFFVDGKIGASIEHLSSYLHGEQTWICATYRHLLDHDACIPLPIFALIVFTKVKQLYQANVHFFLSLKATAQNFILFINL